MRLTGRGRGSKCEAGPRRVPGPGLLCGLLLMCVDLPGQAEVSSLSRFC